MPRGAQMVNEATVKVTVWMPLCRQWRKSGSRICFLNLSLFKKREFGTHWYMCTDPEDLHLGTPLVVQWLRTCSLTQGIWVLSLAGELRFHMLWATKPSWHNYWACMLQLKKPTRCNKDFAQPRKENLNPLSLTGHPVCFGASHTTDVSLFLHLWNRESNISVA